MKFVATTTAALLLAGTAFAGNLVFEAPVEEEVVVQEEPMGGSNAAWLVPLLAIGLIALAVSGGDDDDDDGDDEEDS